MWGTCQAWWESAVNMLAHMWASILASPVVQRILASPYVQSTGGWLLALPRDHPYLLYSFYVIAGVSVASVCFYLWYRKALQPLGVGQRARQETSAAFSALAGGLTPSALPDDAVEESMGTRGQAEICREMARFLPPAPAAAFLQSSLLGRRRCESTAYPPQKLPSPYSLSTESRWFGGVDVCLNAECSYTLDSFFQLPAGGSQASSDSDERSSSNSVQSPSLGSKRPLSSPHTASGSDQHSSDESSDVVKSAVDRGESVAGESEAQCLAHTQDASPPPSKMNLWDRMLIHVEKLQNFWGGGAEYVEVDHTRTMASRRGSVDGGMNLSKQGQDMGKVLFDAEFKTDSADENGESYAEAGQGHCEEEVKVEDAFEVKSSQSGDCSEMQGIVRVEVLQGLGTHRTFFALNDVGSLPLLRIFSADSPSKGRKQTGSASARPSQRMQACLQQVHGSWDATPLDIQSCDLKIKPLLHDFAGGSSSRSQYNGGALNNQDGRGGADGAQGTDLGSVAARSFQQQRFAFFSQALSKFASGLSNEHIMTLFSMLELVEVPVGTILFAHAFVAPFGLDGATANTARGDAMLSTSDGVYFVLGGEVSVYERQVRSRERDDSRYVFLYSKPKGTCLNMRAGLYQSGHLDWFARERRVGALQRIFVVSGGVPDMRAVEEDDHTVLWTSHNRDPRPSDRCRLLYLPNKRIQHLKQKELYVFLSFLTTTFSADMDAVRDVASVQPGVPLPRTLAPPHGLSGSVDSATLFPFYFEASSASELSSPSPESSAVGSFLSSLRSPFSPSPSTPGSVSSANHQHPATSPKHSAGAASQTSFLDHLHAFGVASRRIVTVVAGKTALLPDKKSAYKVFVLLRGRCSVRLRALRKATDNCHSSTANQRAMASDGDGRGGEEELKQSVITSDDRWLSAVPEGSDDVGDMYSSEFLLQPGQTLNSAAFITKRATPPSFAVTALPSESVDSSAVDHCVFVYVTAYELVCMMRQHAGKVPDSKTPPEGKIPSSFRGDGASGSRLPSRVKSLVSLFTPFPPPAPPVGCSTFFGRVIDSMLLMSDHMSFLLEYLGVSSEWLPADHPLFIQDSPCTHVYLVKYGRVKCIRSSKVHTGHKYCASNVDDSRWYGEQSAGSESEADGSSGSLQEGKGSIRRLKPEGFFAHHGAVPSAHQGSSVAGEAAPRKQRPRRRKKRGLLRATSTFFQKGGQLLHGFKGGGERFVHNVQKKMKHFQKKMTKMTVPSFAKRMRRTLNKALFGRTARFAGDAQSPGHEAVDPALLSVSEQIHAHLKERLSETQFASQDVLSVHEGLAGPLERQRERPGAGGGGEEEEAFDFDTRYIYRTLCERRSGDALCESSVVEQLNAPTSCLPEDDSCELERGHFEGSAVDSPSFVAGFLAGHCHSYSAVCVRDTEFVRIPLVSLLRLRQQFPRLFAHLLLRLGSAVQAALGGGSSKRNSRQQPVENPPVDQPAASPFSGPVSQSLGSSLSKKSPTMQADRSVVPRPIYERKTRRNCTSIVLLPIHFQMTVSSSQVGKVLVKALQNYGKALYVSPRFFQKVFGPDILSNLTDFHVRMQCLRLMAELEREYDFLLVNCAVRLLYLDDWPLKRKTVSASASTQPASPPPQSSVSDTSQPSSDASTGQVRSQGPSQQALTQYFAWVHLCLRSCDMVYLLADAQQSPLVSSFEYHLLWHPHYPICPEYTPKVLLLLHGYETVLPSFTRRFFFGRSGAAADGQAKSARGAGSKSPEHAIRHHGLQTWFHLRLWPVNRREHDRMVNSLKVRWWRKHRGRLTSENSRGGESKSNDQDKHKAGQQRPPDWMMHGVYVEKSSFAQQAASDSSGLCNPQLHRYFYVPQESFVHFDRVARCTAGDAVGAVLSGGGARGLAHCGALKCVTDLSGCVDYVAGTSQGSFMAAVFSMHSGELPADAVRFLSIMSKKMSGSLGSVLEFVKDATFPMVSYFKGCRFATSIRHLLSYELLRYVRHTVWTRDLEEFEAHFAGSELPDRSPHFPFPPPPQEARIVHSYVEERAGASASTVASAVWSGLGGRTSRSHDGGAWAREDPSPVVLQRKGYKPIYIEDLWVRYFCVTTNVSVVDMNIHDRGPLWPSVCASMSIMEFLPPFSFTRYNESLQVLDIADVQLGAGGNNARDIASSDGNRDKTQGSCDDEGKKSAAPDDVSGAAGVCDADSAVTEQGTSAASTESKSAVEQSGHGWKEGSTYRTRMVDVRYQQEPVRTDLLIDGGYTNNLPCDIMKEMWGPKYIMAVDVEAKDGTDSPLYDITPFGPGLSGCFLLFYKLFHFMGVLPVICRYVLYTCDLLWRMVAWLVSALCLIFTCGCFRSSRTTNDSQQSTASCFKRWSESLFMRNAYKLPRFSQVVGTLNFMNHNRNIRRNLDTKCIDVYIRPDISTIALLDYHKLPLLLQLGYKTAWHALHRWRFNTAQQAAALPRAAMVSATDSHPTPVRLQTGHAESNRRVWQHVVAGTVPRSGQASPRRRGTSNHNPTVSSSSLNESELTGGGHKPSDGDVGGHQDGSAVSSRLSSALQAFQSPALARSTSEKVRAAQLKRLQRYLARSAISLDKLQAFRSAILFR